jgi:HD-GYP domain-containing protein (c-di-GMP phosphodiesterase class II)
VRTALKVLILLVAIASVCALAMATLLFPLASGFGYLDLAFWTAAALAASAAPVRLPRGVFIAVATCPILAAAFLGGPAAGAWVALVGTLELRELKGSVPWYGTVYNHAATVIPAVVAGTAYLALAGSARFEATPLTLVAAIGSGLGFFAINSVLVSAAIALREEGASVKSILLSDWALVAASFMALSPLAWLMALVSVAVGEWAALLFGLPLATTRGAYHRVVEIRDMFTQTIRSLASAVDAKDKFTAGHSRGVQEISIQIGRQMRCSEAEVEALEWGGLLHDIGKIGVPDAVLLKPDRLTREERIIMNMHPVKGEEIIKPVKRLAPELPIIRHHHEWYNGSGYPDGLVGEAIPWLARILHVADSFEAMTAARPYRMNPLSEEIALSELRKYAGIQFDPKVVAAFERLIARHPDWASKDAPRLVPQRPLPVLGQRDTEAQPA